MRIPPDADIVQGSRLTVIRAASSLHEKVCGRGGLSEKVKATLVDKRAHYAASDLVNARLQPGSATGLIEPAALFALVSAGRLTKEQFLACVAVRKEPLAEHLSGAEIANLATPVLNPTPSLITEWKSGNVMSGQELAQLVIDYWPGRA